MSAIRNLNKQLEQKAAANYILLRRNEIFREVEDRMLAAEARNGELENALKDYLAEFETISSEFAECAQKLANTEHQIEETNQIN